MDLAGAVATGGRGGGGRACRRGGGTVGADRARAARGRAGGGLAARGGACRRPGRARPAPVARRGGRGAAGGDGSRAGAPRGWTDVSRRRAHGGPARHPCRRVGCGRQGLARSRGARAAHLRHHRPTPARPAPGGPHRRQCRGLGPGAPRGDRVAAVTGAGPRGGRRDRGPRCGSRGAGGRGRCRGEPGCRAGVRCVPGGRGDTRDPAHVARVAGRDAARTRAHGHRGWAAGPVVARRDHRRRSHPGRPRGAGARGWMARLAVVRLHGDRERRGCRPARARAPPSVERRRRPAGRRAADRWTDLPRPRRRATVPWGAAGARADGLRGLPRRPRRRGRSSLLRRLAAHR